MSNHELKRESNQRVSEMSEQLKQTHSGKMYPSADDAQSRAEYIGGLVQTSIDALSLSYPLFSDSAEGVSIRRGKVNLDSLEEVTATAYRFLTACVRTGTIPSFTMFCPMLGYSRIHVYEIMRKRKNAVTEFLSVLQTVFAGVLEQVTLARRCSEAGGIFILKNSGQGFVDRADLLVESKSGNVEPFENGDPEEIARKYLAGMAIPTEGGHYDGN